MQHAAAGVSRYCRLRYKAHPKTLHWKSNMNSGIKALTFFKLDDFFSFSLASQAIRSLD